MKLVEFRAGQSIESAHEQLLEESKKFNTPTAGEFNATVISSDMTLDECFVKVTGKTKAELEEAQRKFKEDYEKAEQEHKDHIPEIVEMFKDKAKGLIKEDKWDYFCEILPIRVGDLYHGMEIESMLEIIKVLKEHQDNPAEAIVESRKVFEKQGHSGMSANLTTRLILTFSPWHGQLFIDKVYKG